MKTATEPALRQEARPIPRRWVVVLHPKLPGARAVADAVVAEGAAGAETAVYDSVYDPVLRARVAAGEFDLMVVLGGDGTMLRAGHLCAPHGLPILGVNLGHFGFLFEVKRDGWREAFARVRTGDYWLERRMMLRATHRRGSESLGAHDVLNECVVSRGSVARPIRVTAEIDGEPLTTYVADGLIAATATGSTAYALAAGGPILPPELRNILIVPVAPHLSIDRAIVLAEGATVSMVVRTDHDAILSADGQSPVTVADGDRVDVRASSHEVLMVRVQDPLYFYRTLTERLNHTRKFDEAE